eukprot:COSAG04_NODE_25128_length_311_cov_1.462264_2_plen_28_part_01
MLKSGRQKPLRSPCAPTYCRREGARENT